MKDPSGQKLNVELKIRKEGSGVPPRAPAGPNMDRGRNNNPGNGNMGMNRNGSGGRGERRGEDRGGPRQFNRTDRNPMGPRNGAPNGAATTYANPQRR